MCSNWQTMHRVYAYKKCGTCRKALKWLTDANVAFQEVDITERPPSVAELQTVLTLTGLPVAKLFNTSGQSYREGDFKNRLQTMSQSEALEALSRDGKLIKRPLVLGRDFSLVGFDEDSYRKTFAR